MDKLKEDYKKLINSKEFDKQGYFCSAFLMKDFKDFDPKLISWQFDFYNDFSDTITTYDLSDGIKKTENSKVFKEDSTKIENLDMNEVKIDFEEVLKKCKKILKKQYEHPNKIIAILQKIKRPVWNITYITDNFNMLNIKVDAVNGKIIDEKKSSLLSFDTGKNPKETQ